MSRAWKLKSDGSPGRVLGSGSKLMVLIAARTLDIMPGPRRQMRAAGGDCTGFTYGRPRIRGLLSCRRSHRPAKMSIVHVDVFPGRVLVRRYAAWR
jgi:hypothetical protein